MINTITGGRGITVTTSGSTYVAKSYNSSSTHMLGQMMYDVDSQTMKVYDGSNWQSLYAGSSTVTLDTDTVSLLEWARMKRSEEQELERLAETNVAIKDLVNQIKEKQEQLKVVQTLIKKEQTVS